MRQHWIVAKTGTLVCGEGNVRASGCRNVVKHTDGGAIMPLLLARRAIEIGVEETFVNNRSIVSFRGSGDGKKIKYALNNGRLSE
jgi:hypothetical protein